MTNAYHKLEEQFAKLADLQHIEQMLIWDEATMMPAGGGPARAQSLATLKGMQHDIVTQSQMAEWIEQAKQIVNLNEWQNMNVFWMEKQYKKNNCLPKTLVEQLKASSIESEQAWRVYRAENNWISFLPYLEKTFSLVKETAEISADQLGVSAYDALIDDYSPGMTQKIIDPLFNQLKKELPPLIDSILEKQRNDSVLLPKGPFEIIKQYALGKELMTAIGFDFHHGRLDSSHHPFCGGTPEDVRITTRYREDEFTSAILGICHETGHALYEQGLPKQWRRQPVGQALGMAVHESQSLIIEMDACRSREFNEFLSRKLQAYFGDDPTLAPSNLYQYHTQVKRSLIRVDADEVTYPLHIVLRYEIEKDLLAGKINCRDLPEIWDIKMKNFFDISTKSNDKDGVMQDVHWPAGNFGYFPAYTLGRLMAAQFFARALQDYPDLIQQLSQGNFTLLKTWLNKRVHSIASSLNNEQLLKSATGEALNPNYFLQHIQQRYALKTAAWEQRDNPTN